MVGRNIDGRPIFGGETNIRDDEERRGAGTRSLAQLRAVLEREEEALALQRESAEREQLVEHGLQQALAWTCASRNAAELVMQQLHAESSVAASDVSVLAKDLPTLLQNRCSELQQWMAEVEALAERSRMGRLDEERLDEEREWRYGHARELRQQAEVVLQRSGSAYAVCSNAAQAARELTDRQGRVLLTIRELEAFIQREALLEQQHARELENLRVDATRMRAMVAERGRQHEDGAQQIWEREESVCLARRLEVVDLGRTLTLQQQQLQDKALEAAWWREQASQLGQGLEMARARRDSQVAELTCHPLIPGPLR